MKIYSESSNKRDSEESTDDCNKSIYEILEGYDKETVDDIIKKIKKNYIMIKKPVRFCHNCFYYKKIKPGEIMFTGPLFPKIESCEKGHAMYDGIAADCCSDYYEINKNSHRYVRKDIWDLNNMKNINNIW